MILPLYFWSVVRLDVHCNVMMSPHVQVDYNWAYFSDERKR